MYYKLICILYALVCGQNFILVKSGCYTELREIVGSDTERFPPISIRVDLTCEA
jgi:hypothetical protein